MPLSTIFQIAALSLISNGALAEAKKPNIVVIGAGLAGLTTAYRLQQKGLDVHVYEARKRVGGRVFTVKIGDELAELGGQNITDGGDAENMRSLIAEFSLEPTKYKVHLDYQYLTQDGFISGDLLYKEKFDSEDLKSQLAQAAQKAHNMRDVLNTLLEENDPLYKVLSVRLAAYEGAIIDKLSPLYIDTLYHMLLGGLSAAHQNVEKENYVDMISIKGGNALLPEKLAQSLGDNIHLNMPLVAISKAIDNCYELIFQNGEIVKTDIVVLAVPCSVYNDIHFEKDLIPEKKLEAIKNVQYGTNAKILVPVSQTPNPKTTFINDRMGSFFSNHNVLTLYYTGDAGKFSEITISQAYQQEHSMLEKGLGKLCPPFLAPSYARDESFISYDGPVGYSWPNDPYVKGTYSYISPGQETLLTAIEKQGEELIKTLFAPIDQTLYFAGEHASILMEVPGTMEAACESGERTARMIEKALKIFKKK